MPLKVDALEEPQMNLTPMLDVVFNLMIFFMVSTRFAEMERQFDVQLPQVSAAKPLSSAPDEIVVNVFSTGRILVGDKVFTPAELEAYLREARRRYADQTVVVRGDGRGTFQTVMNVLNACQKAGVRNLSLAAEISAGTP